MTSRGSRLIPFFERGKGFRLRQPHKPFVIDDDYLTELRLKYPGSKGGRPRDDGPNVGGLGRISKILGVPRATISHRLRKIAERQEAAE